MEITQFKKQLKTGFIPDDFIIFECEDNYFVANQYVNKICELRQLNKKYITSIFEAQNSMTQLFEADDSPITLYVLETDTFDEYSESYTSFKNTVVICKKIKTRGSTDIADFTTKIPALSFENIIAYMKAICPGLAIGNNEDLLLNFYNSTNGDIYKIDSELSKIKLFESDDQAQVLSKLLYSPESDLYALKIFELTNAILNLSKASKNDLTVILEFLIKGKSCFSSKLAGDTQEKADPIAIANILLKNVRDLLLVSPTSGIYSAAEFESFGISAAKKSKLQKTYRFSSDFLRDKIKFLANVDLRLKSSKLELSKERLFDYILCNMA